jgi:hypothetical protein
LHSSASTFQQLLIDNPRKIAVSESTPPEALQQYYRISAFSVFSLSFIHEQWRGFLPLKLHETLTFDLKAQPIFLDNNKKP